VFGIRLSFIGPTQVTYLKDVFRFRFGIDHRLNLFSLSKFVCRLTYLQLSN
jgi:hypothetical protein